jgi:asparagine synthase (glutamine-hydrolysing)
MEAAREFARSHGAPPGAAGRTWTAGDLARAEAATTLPMLLEVEDRVTMWHGLECRPVPSLGRVRSVAARLSEDALVGRDGEGKRVLREALRGAIPEPVRTNPAKRGFPTPFHRAACGAGRDVADAILSDRRFAERGWWDVARCRGLLGADRPAHDRALFAVLALETWARLFLDGDAFAGIRVP